MKYLLILIFISYQGDITTEKMCVASLDVCNESGKLSLMFDATSTEYTVNYQCLPLGKECP